MQFKQNFHEELRDMTVRCLLQVMGRMDEGLSGILGGNGDVSPATYVL